MIISKIRSYYTCAIRAMATGTHTLTHARTHARTADRLHSFYSHPHINIIYLPPPTIAITQTHSLSRTHSRTYTHNFFLSLSLSLKQSLFSTRLLPQNSLSPMFANSNLDYLHPRILRHPPPPNPRQLNPAQMFFSGLNFPPPPSSLPPLEVLQFRQRQRASPPPPTSMSAPVPKVQKPGSMLLALKMILSEFNDDDASWQIIHSK